MLSSNTRKKLTLCSMAAVLCGAGQLANAHTGIKDQATEGKTLYTGFTIGHGCGSTDVPTQLPVIAQSAVFPNATDSVAHQLNSDGTNGATIDLSTVISGAIGGATGLSPKGVQDHNIFRKAAAIKDSAGSIRGLELTSGNLDTDFVGVVPFKVSGLTFVQTSCAKSLKVRIAIANWCEKTNDTNDDRRVDVWIGHMTTLFNDPGVMPENFATSPYWPTMTVNRDLVANPLPSSCGAGFDVAVEPSDADIDANLPVKGYWPANN